MMLQSRGEWELGGGVRRGRRRRRRREDKLT
jgi:hypothetical protein